MYFISLYNCFSILFNKETKVSSFSILTSSKIKVVKSATTSFIPSIDVSLSKTGILIKNLCFPLHRSNIFAYAVSNTIEGVVLYSAALFFNTFHSFILILNFLLVNHGLSMFSGFTATGNSMSCGRQSILELQYSFALL